MIKKNEPPTLVTSRAQTKGNEVLEKFEPYCKPKSPARIFRVGTQHLRMARRKNEIIRLGQWRWKYNVHLDDPQGFALALAGTLFFCRGDFDFVSVSEVLAAARVSLSEEVIMAAIHRVCRTAKVKGAEYRPISDTITGRLLDLTCEERLDCGIITMRAVDETFDERAERVLENKRARDREADRRRRAGAGAVPRAIYEATSITRAEPWKKVGLPRSTYYKLKAAKRAETSASLPQTRAETGARDLSHPITSLKLQLQSPDEAPSSEAKTCLSREAAAPSHIMKASSK
jgi:hypothetical protein